MHYYYFKYLIALHILKDLQDRLYADSYVKDFPLWEACKNLLGEEHAQIVFEMDIPDDVRSHSLLYGD